MITARYCQNEAPPVVEIAVEDISLHIYDGLVTFTLSPSAALLLASGLAAEAVKGLK